MEAGLSNHVWSISEIVDLAAMPPNYRRIAEGGGINQTATPGPF
jgi:hypothetical protein